LINTNRFFVNFGRNVKAKASNQKMFSFPPYLTITSALPGKIRKNEKHTFSLNYCNTALPDFNQSLLDFFNLVD